MAKMRTATQNALRTRPACTASERLWDGPRFGLIPSASPPVGAFLHGVSSFPPFCAFLQGLSSMASTCLRKHGAFGSSSRQPSQAENSHASLG